MMIPSQPIYNSSEHGCGFGDDDHTLTTLHANSTDDRVQPTDNPYHWEALVGNRSNLSTWAKAAWCQTSEVVRLETSTGSLKRNTATRRSGKARMSERTTSSTRSAFKSASKASATVARGNANHIPCSLPEHRFHRRFSFEDEDRSAQPSISFESGEADQAVSNMMTRIDSGVVHDRKGRSTRFREDLDEQPPVTPTFSTPTFSDILGEIFVPTALLEDDEN